MSDKMCKQWIDFFSHHHTYARIHTLHATFRCVHILDAEVKTWIVKMIVEHKNALEKSLHDICQDLDTENILPYLRSKGIVEEGQVQEIMRINRKSTQNMQLIDFIKGAGPSAFQEFINALHIDNKDFLAEKILAHLPSSNQQLLPESITIAQQSLKDLYMTIFKKVYPFSLPFTFDIENTWVSLALKEEKKNSHVTEDHAELLKRVFDKVKMLIIEGDPATGKTCLMRRLAYEWARQENNTETKNCIHAASSVLGKIKADWAREGHMEQIHTTDKRANGKQELLHFDLVLYAEFREVREKTFKNIADLVLGGLEKNLTKDGYENLQKLVNNEQFCKENRILVLLDGYDESSLENQCSEFSSYIQEKTINKQLFFDTVITTRKGYLSNLRGREGRFVFAEVLGFTTKQQKEKYIYNHFLSSEIDNREKIAEVNRLLNSNENLNKLAETPLFLTFICLVHERIIDGTLLELYCNIIWWLIDRHQQDFPDRDIPALFGFQNGYDNKFETIQEHYLHFPQLHCLGKMAWHNLKENAFKPSDYSQFNLQPITEHVGLLRKEKKYDNLFKLATSFHFPHRTIQEFLAAFYLLCSIDSTSEWLLPNFKLDTTEYAMNEFERFLFRIALSDNMPIQAEKRKYYFERIADIVLDVTFDIFNTPASSNNKLLNRFLSQCKNVQNITLENKCKSPGQARNMLNNKSVHSESPIAFGISSLILFSFDDLIKLHSVTFGNYTFGCRFSANSQLTFTNCRSLRNLEFRICKMKSRTNLGIATLPAIDTVQFYVCSNDLATWDAITDQIRNSSVKCLKLNFGRDFQKEVLVYLQKCNNVKKMEVTISDYTIFQNDLFSFNCLIKLHSVTFRRCTFKANSPLSFKNCLFLKSLVFCYCMIESDSNLGIATLPSVDTVEFEKCEIDLATWQSITEQIRNSSVKCLHLSADYFAKETYLEFLHFLQKCERIHQIHVMDIWDITIGKFILNLNEEEVTANLVQTAQKMPELTSITIVLDEGGIRLNKSRKLQERNKVRIEKAGQERNLDFSIQYVIKSLT